jgi:hypothetical protein
VHRQHTQACSDDAIREPLRGSGCARQAPALGGPVEQAPASDACHAQVAQALGCAQKPVGACSSGGGSQD